MGSLVLGSMLGGGGGGGVTTAPGPAQPAPPAFRQAMAQPPQVPGVQAQQAPAVLAKQGLDQMQIQTRLADLDDQKFFQSPAERVEETRKVPPRGLLSAGAGETEEEEKQEKPRGILGI